MEANIQKDEETCIFAPDNTHMRTEHETMRLTHGRGAWHLVSCTHMRLAHGFVLPSMAKTGQN